MKFRVWWIPQIPMKPFYVPVNSIKEAQLILKVLEDYDWFQYENKIKPIYCNAGGIAYQDENGEWWDWIEEEHLKEEGDKQ